MTAFCSWSGGKESSLALQRAMESGVEVDYLVTIFPSENSTVGHGLPSDFYLMQGVAMRKEMKWTRTDWENYEANFSELVKDIQPDKGLFGDVYLDDHLEWVNNFARGLGFEPLEPLWGEDPKELYLEFLERDFRGIVVKVDPEEVSPEWLGKELDDDFLNYLLDKGICPLGEGGEYHTAVLDGPFFEMGIEVELGGERNYGDDRIVELVDYELV